MDRRTSGLSRLVSLLLLCGLVACAVDPLARGGLQPTARPVIAVTPAPAQDVPATATAYARRSLPTPTPAGMYIVKPGDTLTTIADANETTVEEIMTLNNISNPDMIQVGQQLTLPYAVATPVTTSLAEMTALAEP